MELNRDAGRLFVLRTSTDNLPFSFALYSLTISGDRNWDLDLINVTIALTSVSMSIRLRNVRSLENHTHGIQILLYVMKLSSVHEAEDFPIRLGKV